MTMRAPTLLAAACAALVLAVAAPVASAQLRNQEATGPTATKPVDPAAEKRLKVLAEELRCLVCQNQTLADSHAELAVDLRNQVYALIAKGMSDEEIKKYLVERYGDFVLYRPPVQGNTVLLWVGPFALLALGAGIWVVVQRRSRLAAAQTAATPDADQERARKLLEG